MVLPHETTILYGETYHFFSRTARFQVARRTPEPGDSSRWSVRNFSPEMEVKIPEVGFNGNLCVYIYILGLIVIIYILIDWDVSWESNGMFQIFHDDTVIPDQQQSYGCDWKWYRNFNREHNAQASSVHRIFRHSQIYESMKIAFIGKIQYWLT